MFKKTLPILHLLVSDRTASPLFTMNLLKNINKKAKFGSKSNYCFRSAGFLDKLNDHVLIILLN